MEKDLSRNIRVLQGCVAVLFLSTALLVVNGLHPLLPAQNFKVINAERINIREGNGVLKAALSNAAGFSEGQRAAGAKFSGLMFYNEEGQETGGLTFRGKAIPGGQDSDVTLSFDQYRQDQNVYLHHEEFKDPKGTRIDDGLTINARPDWTGVKQEYAIYRELKNLPQAEQDKVRLQSLQVGKISSSRLFLGVSRGVNAGVPYDYTGLFIKNKWGRNAIRIYVDNQNKPHFEVYDELGKARLYDLKLPPAGEAPSQKPQPGAPKSG